MLHSTIKNIAKMICRKGMGLLTVTHVSETEISFRNGSNVFSYCLDNELYEGCGTFAAGHVIEGEKIDLTFEIEKLQQIAKATIYVSGAKLHADSRSDDMYKAIDLLIDKLDRQIKEHKDRQSEH